MNSDRRSSPRVPLLIRVNLIVNGVVHDATTTDMSESGIFVQVAVLPSVGTSVRVDLQGKQPFGPSVRYAEIVRHASDVGALRGVGMRWVEKDAAEATSPAGEEAEKSSPPDDPVADSTEEIAPPEEVSPATGEDEAGVPSEEDDMPEEHRALEPRSAAMDRWANVYKVGRPVRFAVQEEWFVGKVLDYMSDGSLSIESKETMPASQERICLAAPYVVDRRLDIVRVLGEVQDVVPGSEGQLGGTFNVILDRLQPL